MDGGSHAVLELVGDDVLGSHKQRHSFPYDWRTKRPVVTRATAQWFADVGSIKDDALEALKDVQFVPKGGRNRLEAFITRRSECVLRLPGSLMTQMNLLGFHPTWRANTVEALIQWMFGLTAAAHGQKPRALPMSTLKVPINTVDGSNPAY
ncbi:hypothetical protein LB505_008171 [Fusarium chuoi]|nr:hypothetical protein LB505_008171 [Fusarium chuoi]